MNVVVAEDYEDLSRRAAAWLRSVLAGIGNPTVVLPTGNTPIGLYRNLAADPNRQFLGNARFVQLDEYQGIPREDSRTLSRWFRSVFLQPLSIPLTALLSFDPSVPDPDGEAARVDAAVTQAGIDVFVLCLGPNGHLGFNDPGRTMVSGLVSSAQCTSKYDGKPGEPFFPPSSSWIVSRERRPNA